MARVLDPSAPIATTSRERVTALLGTRRRLVVGLVASSVVSSVAESAMLVALVAVAAQVVKGSHGHSVGRELLHFSASVPVLFAIAGAAALIRLAMQFPISYLPAKIGSQVQSQLRRDVSRAFARTSWAEQSSDREGYLQETMTTQVLQATQGALQATSMLAALTAFLIFMATALVINWKAAVLLFVVALALLLVVRPMKRLGVRRSRELSRSQLEFAGALSEMQRVAAESQVFGVEEQQRRRLERYINAARDLFYRSQLIVRLTPNLYQSLIYILLIVGLTALYEINRHDLVSLGAVVLLLVRAGTTGQQVQAAQQGLNQSLPFIERLQETAKRYAAAKPAAGEEPLVHIERLGFEHVSFGYRPDEQVLGDISFEVFESETIGVIGPSGAGKSTLVQLLLQLREPTAGAFLVNGVPAASFSREDWHKLVSYVPQEPKLLHTSVAENIRFLREDLSDADVERAARLAHIHDVVLGWPGGYETTIGPRADGVSGGQQQRICLARALAAKPEVLILDEPTSALDPQSESLIQQSLRELKNEMTVFIVAHRMSTLDVCDRVMVILDGRLVAFDPISVLERESDYYRRAASIATGELLP
ncbi:MAG TPA: ABC transporter ATP-binding protein [Solirubrobacteraceae bacterium]|nr:ABC transporter ATP-binding protein [Solirubrobacteraceae bacterium]